MLKCQIETDTGEFKERNENETRDFSLLSFFVSPLSVQPNDSHMAFYIKEKKKRTAIA